MRAIDVLMELGLGAMRSTAEQAGHMIMSDTPERSTRLDEPNLQAVAGSTKAMNM